MHCTSIGETRLGPPSRAYPTSVAQPWCRGAQARDDRDRTLFWRVTSS
jgi:hypothetical protein